MTEIYKSVLDMKDEEIHAKAKPIAEEANRRAWAHNGPISYRNELCTQDDMIIHEYKKGDKEMVSVIADDGSFKKIRDL